MSDHVCPCGCGRGVSVNRLACPTGWAWLQRVRPDLAQDVTHAWTVLRRRTLDDQAKALAKVSHLLAVRAAIQWYRDQRKATS